ncbi:hypothetical protein K1719_037588 [Acacia pycnantha]|nr:hypothetical protein K1719_037588 [Acacia pycnantha]
MGITVPSILRDRFLKILSPEEIWVIFAGPHEHHSNLLSWRQSLAEVIEISLDNEGFPDMDSLKLKLEAYKNIGRPTLGSFSACSNVTGIYSDTRAIATLLHYPHKFLGGPGSPGVLFMNKALHGLRSSPPSTCGGGTVSYVNGFNEKDTLYLESIEERENGGTSQIIQTVRATLVFWVKEYISYKEIEKQEQLFINRALGVLSSYTNCHGVYSRLWPTIPSSV